MRRALRLRLSSLRQPWLAPLAAFVVLAVVIGCGGAGGGAAASGDTGTGSGGSGGSSGGGSGGSSSGGGSGTGGSGTSGGGTGGGSGGGTTGGSLQIAPASVGGQFEMHVLTGVGRSLDNYDLEIGGMELRGAGGSLLSGFSPRWVSLDLYQASLFTMGIATSPSSRNFDQFLMTFNRLQEPGGAIFPGPIVKTVVAKMRLSKGRTTAVQVLLDPTMFVPENGTLTFSDSAFDALNTDPYAGTLPAFYTDLIRFDVSSLVSRPTLEAGGQATQLYVSGDLVGLSGVNGLNFEAIFDFDRRLDAQGVRRGLASSGTSSGTYVIQQPDPLGSLNAIPRLSGAWQEAGQVVLNMGVFTALALPSADPSLPDHLLMVARNDSGVITDLWLGTLDVQGGFFTAFPLGELKLFRSTQITGTIADSGSGGTFSILSGPKPSSFPASGTYLRYLR